MHYNRHPIVETVITAKSGYKLSLRSSKQADKDAFKVDAIEIVCFGSGYFYRPTADCPISFLLPASDYEVVEVKEERLTLKNAVISGKVEIGSSDPSQQKQQKSEKKSRRTKKKEEKEPEESAETEGEKPTEEVEEKPKKGAKKKQTASKKKEKKSKADKHEDPENDSEVKEAANESSEAPVVDSNAEDVPEVVSEAENSEEKPAAKRKFRLLAPPRLSKLRKAKGEEEEESGSKEEVKEKAELPEQSEVTPPQETVAESKSDDQDLPISEEKE